MKSRRAIGYCIGLILVVAYIALMNDCQHQRTEYKHTVYPTDTVTSLQQ